AGSSVKVVWSGKTTLACGTLADRHTHVLHHAERSPADLLGPGASHLTAECLLERRRPRKTRRGKRKPRAGAQQIAAGPLVNTASTGDVTVRSGESTSACGTHTNSCTHAPRYTGRNPADLLGQVRNSWWQVRRLGLDIARLAGENVNPA